MGLVRAQLGLRNPVKPELSPMTVDALVDTGALHLCLPEHVVVQLGLSDIPGSVAKVLAVSN